MNNPYEVFAWVNVSNGYVWLQQPDPLMLIRLKEPWIKPPNYAPYFNGWVASHRINATVGKNEQKLHVIQFPAIIDSESNSTYKIAIDGL